MGAGKPGASGAPGGSSGSVKAAHARGAIGDRTIGGAIAGLLLLVVVLAGSIPRPSVEVPPISGIPPSPGASAAASPGPAGTPAPSASAEPWARLTLPPLAVPAELIPTQTDASGVASDAAFVLTSRAGTPADVLATGLETTPAIALRIESGDSPDVATIRPAVPLDPGTVYRFRLHDPSGAVLGSWAYRVAGPLHVVTTLPGHHATEVPTNTGIEITFDQDGALGVAAHVTIEPAVSGRWEVHDRTQVFVPTDPLAPATIYTVSVTAGVTMAGSDQVLEEPLTFAFETGGGPAVTHLPWVEFGRPLLDVHPGEAPVIAVGGEQTETGQLVLKGLPIQIHRLSTYGAALSAAETILGGPTWANYSAHGSVPTTGLDPIRAFEATLEPVAGAGYALIRFPAPLPAGWYLVTSPREGGRPLQLILQITTVATYAMSTESRTLAWVNDTSTGEPIAGATVTTAAGTRIGRTGTGGLATGPTPTELVPVDGWSDASRSRLLIVATRAEDRVIVPLGIQGMSSAYGAEWARLADTSAGRNRNWLLFSSDRTQIRPTDRIEIWGLLRPRDGSAPPDDLEIRLLVGNPWQDDPGAPIARTAVTPGQIGTFATAIPVTNLPFGWYTLELRGGGQRIATLEVQVADIRKPAYRIEVTTDARGLIAGDTVSATARVIFFDGSVAPGLALEVNAFRTSSRVTTDATGTARFTARATVSGTQGASTEWISVRPADPEEGEIGGDAIVWVFPSRVWLAAEGTVAGGRLVVEGHATAVDLARAEAEFAESGWIRDPSGAGIAGHQMEARITEIVPVRRQIGTAYDFVEKRSEPVYTYDQREQFLATVPLVSGPGGAFRIDRAVPDGTHAYRVALSVRDADGRTTTLDTYVSASGRVDPVSTLARPYLQTPWGCGGPARVEASVGDPVTIVLQNADGPIAGGGSARFLFTVNAGGLRESKIQAGSSFTRTFRAADLPNVEVLAVQFTGREYVESANSAVVKVRDADRTLHVALSIDREKYRPGETAEITVRVTDPAGTPAQADVALRAVDEKLYAIGAAFGLDVIGELYSQISSGVLQTYGSHPLPIPGAQDGCGDTAGGGGREDFRDTLLFRIVSTDAAGTATVRIPLSDDLTSWRVSGSAIDGSLRAGSGSVQVPVGLPFFVEATLAPTYLTSDRPVLRVRAYGDDLRAGDRVTITVGAPTLLMAPVTLEARAFESVEVALPALREGVHRIEIGGSAARDPERLTDRLIRTIQVVPSRLTAGTILYESLAADWRPSGGSGLTTYWFTDAGRGRFLPALQDLAWASSARFDRSLAADLARSTLAEMYGIPEASLPERTFDPARYLRWDGIALLPYASLDPALAALAAVAAPGVLDREALASSLDYSATGTREQEIIWLAGRAALGNDVLTEVRAMATLADLTAVEQLWLGLAASAVGDDALARSLERSVLDESGEALGPWVRLRLGGSATVDGRAAGLALLLAARVGDPVADPLERYLREQPTAGIMVDLERVAALRAILERTPSDAARIAVTVDGVRQLIDLPAGETHALVLTAPQRAGLRVEQVTGKTAVTTTWRDLADRAQLPSGGEMTIERTIAPAGLLSRDQPATVTIKVIFPPGSPTGCYRVTDVAPSGLVPLAWAPGWPDETPSRTVVSPYLVEGQLAAWCVDPGYPKGWTLTYRLRVVSPGTYTWEPAVLESEVVPGLGATTEPAQVTIR